VKSAVCTLFEGSYHHGLAALANSLQGTGFAGTLYAGYRGVLPAWAAAAAPLPLPGWPEASSLPVGEHLRITFLPLRTAYHLTNLKPRFMLELLDGPLARPGAEVEALFYIDPDICALGRWSYFEDWVGCGVALCEDLNSPLPENHPRRVAWRRYYGERGLTLRYRASDYVNGGFVGVRRADRAFLECWQRTMELMAEEIGSLAAAKVGGGAAYRSTGPADCFDCSDQDALNAAVEACGLDVSVMGQEAMAFKPGRALLPHAVGAAKPWQRGYLRAAFGGVAPRQADKAYWAHAQSPITSHGAWQRLLRRIDLVAASAVGRLVRRS